MSESDFSVLPRAPSSPFTATTIALSGSIDAERLRRGIARLAEQGVRHDPPDAALAQWRYFAGDDDHRLRALEQALAGDAQVVFFGRGGYGLSRLLTRIDWAAVAASGKVFCGYSDVTAFSLAALAQVRYVSIAGPVTAGEFAQAEPSEDSLYAEQHLFALLAASRYDYPVCQSDIEHAPATIDGVVWGTNLAMISHLVGTPYMPRIDDGILVLEDIGEAPYRVERMLLQLKLAGILDRQRAIVLGAFTDCEPAPGMRYPYSLTEVIETLRDIAPCPVVTGFPFGHVQRKVSLPIGAPARLAISGSQYRLSVHDYLRD